VLSSTLERETGRRRPSSRRCGGPRWVWTPWRVE
jgi:hypothetical protein